MASSVGPLSATGAIKRTDVCVHYKRKAKYVTPCCNLVYSCRFCHDEKENHVLNRRGVKEVICVRCNTRQTVGKSCTFCGVNFGNYTCLICNLFDDEDKGQFHCRGCGICRIGGADNYFHCQTCNMCLPVQIRNNHKCVENASHTDCPLCLEDIHTSRTSSIIPRCGHLIHMTCFANMIDGPIDRDRKNTENCPICQDSMIDLIKRFRIQNQKKPK